MPASLALLAAARGPRRPGVDHGLHPHTGPVQVERGVVGAVVRGEHDDLAAREHAVAVQERAGGTREHDARAGRCRRRRPGARARPVATTIERARMRHTRWRERCFGAEGPEVVGAPLEREDEPVVVRAERGGALQVQHLRVRGQLGDRGGDPVERRCAVEPVGARQQRATGLGLLVDEGDAGPGPGGAERGGQARGPGAHDEHVDVVVHGVVAGGVRDVGQAGPGPADRRPPGRRRARRWTASSIGSGNGSSICTRPPASSAQAAVMPRGRPSLTLVAIRCVPDGEQRRGEGVAGVAGVRAARRR